MTLRDHVLVRNGHPDPLTLATYATDAHSDAAGRFTLLAAAEEPTGLGTWLQVPEQVVVPASGQALVPVRLQVPDDARPGDHVAGVITSSGRAVTGADGERVLVDTRLAVRVHVRVDGPAKASLDLGELVVERDRGRWWNPFDDTATVRYRAQNTGDVRLELQHTVFARGPFGLELGRRSGTALGDLLPQGDVVLGAGAEAGADTSVVDLVAPLGGTSVEVTVRATDLVTGKPLEPQVLGGPLPGSRWTWAPWVMVLTGAGASVVLGLRAVRRRG
jgi:hypothetical protein